VSVTIFRREGFQVKKEPYAHDPLIFYPGRRLSDEEKRRIDAFELSIGEVTVDHLVYAMGRQIENNFQTFYTVAEEIIGDKTALKIAYEIGLRYGGRGYATFLKARNRGDNGDARMMALYQDFVHSIRGPKHVAALYAEYDDTRCIVRRQECIYYAEAYPQNGKYAGAFEEGCFEGYKRADRNLLRVEVHKCRWKGDASCEQHWVYKD